MFTHNIFRLPQFAVCGESRIIYGTQAPGNLDKSADHREPMQSDADVLAAIDTVDFDSGVARDGAINATEKALSGVPPMHENINMSIPGFGQDSITIKIAAEATVPNDPGTEIDPLTATQEQLDDSPIGTQETAAEHPGPQTNRANLEQRINDLNAKLEKPDLTGTEALMTTLEMLATIVEMFKRTLEGTLDAPVEKEEDKNDAEAPVDSQEPSAEADLIAAVRTEVQERGAITPENQSVALREVMQESQANIDQNNATIGRIGGNIDEKQQQQRDLAPKVLEAQDALTDARRNNADDGEIDRLELELKSIKDQQEALQKTIDEQIELKKKLEAENAAFARKKETAEKMQSGTDFILEQIGKVEKALEKLLHAKVKFESNDGEQRMVVSDLTRETPEWVTEFLAAHDANGEAKNGHYVLDLTNAEYLSEYEHNEENG